MKCCWLVVALLLPACAPGPVVSSDASPSREWLIGHWIVSDDGSRRACQGDTGVRYAADGTYNLLEEVGVWRLEGDRLSETATKATEVAAPGEVEVGRTVLSRIRRQAPDEMVKTLAEESTLLLLRCPTRR